VAGSTAAGVSFATYKGVQFNYYRTVVQNRSKTQALMLLDGWDLLGKEEKERRLPPLETCLVPLKRVWAELKKELENDFDWWEPVVGDGMFWYTKDRTTQGLPDLSHLADRLKELCRTPEHVLVENVLHVLERWEILALLAQSADPEESREALDLLDLALPHVRDLLVPIKTNWKKLKEKLQERYEWDEPWIGNGTFLHLKDPNGHPQLPDLMGMAEDIIKICTVDDL